MLAMKTTVTEKSIRDILTKAISIKIRTEIKLS